MSDPRFFVEVVTEWQWIQRCSNGPQIHPPFDHMTVRSYRSKGSNSSGNGWERGINVILLSNSQLSLSFPDWCGAIEPCWPTFGNSVSTSNQGLVNWHFLRLKEVCAVVGNGVPFKLCTKPHMHILIKIDWFECQLFRFTTKKC